MTNSPDSQHPDLLGLLPDELGVFLKALGEPVYRARQLFAWLHRGASFEEMSDLPLPLRRRLAELATAGTLTLAAKETAPDGATKFGFRTADGHVIETVLIPERRQQRQAKDAKRKGDEVDGLAQDVIQRAGNHPSVPQALACPAGSAGDPPPVRHSLGDVGSVRHSLGGGGCPYCDSKSKLWYQPTVDAPFAMIPCPWCVGGRRELLAQIAGGKRFDHVNWRLVKEQLGERLRRRALEVAR